MRLASFNVENLFDRAKALNQSTWAEGKPVLDRFARLTALLGEVIYTNADKAEIVDLMTALGLAKGDEGPFVIMRRNRGGLVRRPRNGDPMEVVASGRADWVGWVELKTEVVNERAMQNTARVIADVGADVMGIVEVESRPVLSEFNRHVLPAVGGAVYRHVMVIDGNDDRGIDVGVIARDGFAIGLMQSHVDDCDAGDNRIFSRDCPEFFIDTPQGNRLLVMVNHFKSKGGGSQAASDRRRRAQAERVRDLYRDRIAAGHDLIAIVGDLNDTPESDPLAPLIDETDLTDIFALPGFDDCGHPGTFGDSKARNKLDYILLSPALFAKATAGGIFRRGMWPGVRPRKWDAYPEITREVEAASDHGAVWADLDI